MTIDRKQPPAEHLTADGIPILRKPQLHKRLLAVLEDRGSDAVIIRGRDDDAPFFRVAPVGASQPGGGNAK